MRAGHRALVRSVFGLVQDFAEAEATGERRTLVQQLTRVDLLILEDFGLKKLGPSAEDLLEVFVRRHEGGSTLITRIARPRTEASSSMSPNDRRRGFDVFGRSPVVRPPA